MKWSLMSMSVIAVFTTLTGAGRTDPPVFVRPAFPVGAFGSPYPAYPAYGPARTDRQGIPIGPQRVMYGPGFGMAQPHHGPSFGMAPPNLGPGFGGVQPFFYASPFGLSAMQVRTTVWVPNGGTAMVGGYTWMSEGRNEFGVPVLGKVPYAGRLFRNAGYGRGGGAGFLTVGGQIIDLRAEERRQTGVGR